MLELHMIIKDINGKEHKWNFSKNYDRKYRSGKSSLHTKARELIKEIYPSYSIYEECTLPGTKPALYADFFIPQLKKMFEIQGQQHTVFTPFFHKSKLDFYLAQARDREKAEFCRINDIQLIVLPFDQQNNWRELIGT